MQRSGVYRQDTSLEMTEMVIILMGVSGCGKTSVGKALAERLSWPFFDADDYHSTANKEKMALGTPLTDEDRWMWLQKLRQLITNLPGKNGILACSCLKRSYRNILSHPSEGRKELTGSPIVLYIHLVGTPEMISRRLRNRKGHFMPESLLRSQYETLEHLEASENGFEISVQSDIRDTVHKIVLQLHTQRIVQ